MPGNSGGRGAGAGAGTQGPSTGAAPFAPQGLGSPGFSSRSRTADQAPAGPSLAHHAAPSVQLPAADPDTPPGLKEAVRGLETPEQVGGLPTGRSAGAGGKQPKPMNPQPPGSIVTASDPKRRSATWSRQDAPVCSRALLLCPASRVPSPSPCGAVPWRTPRSSHRSHTSLSDAAYCLPSARPKSRRSFTPWLPLPTSAQVLDVATALFPRWALAGCRLAAPSLLRLAAAEAPPEGGGS